MAIATPTERWEHAVYACARTLQQRFPELVGDRMESAIVLVRDGQVAENADEQLVVASRSEPGKFHTIRPDGSCLCDDARYQAPAGRCAHRIAAGLYKHAHVFLQQQQQTPHAINGQTPLSEPDPTSIPLTSPPPTTPNVSHAAWGSNHRSIRTIVTDLSRPLPAACIATKTLRAKSGKSAQIAYLHWTTVAKVLDAYAPGWQGTVERIERVGTACVITYRLTIPCLEGLIVREATGQEEEEVDGYGDSTSNAEAMAFKRAAAKFGVGRWLYDKDPTAQAVDAYLTQHIT